MRTLLLGGPLDGEYVKGWHNELRVPVRGRVTEVVLGVEPDLSTRGPMVHVYGGPRLCNPDREEDLVALRYQGVE